MFQYPDKGVLKLSVVLEHSMRFQVFEMEAAEDVTIVKALTLQTHLVKVQSLQAIDEISPLALLNPTLRR